MDKKKQGIDTDLKVLTVHEPSNDFTSRVAIQAIHEIETMQSIHRPMKWIPYFCAASFMLLFLVFLVLVIRYTSIDSIHPNVWFSLKAIGLFGIGYFLFLLLDRFLKRLIVR